MIDGKSVLAIIPARGGSKGILRKNLRPVGGKPLIAWTIEAARGSEHIDRLVLSSEDEEIIRVAGQYGCEAPFVRPAELARDDTPGVAPVLHALSQLPGYEYVVLLQPTSPLRRTSDIDACLKRCVASGVGGCVSVTEAQQTPYWMYTQDSNGCLEPFVKDAPTYTRRQDIFPVYVLNGAVYAVETKRVIASERMSWPGIAAYVMPAERSFDLDTEADFQMAEFMLSKRGSSS